MSNATHRLQAALRAPTFAVCRRDPGRPQPVHEHAFVSAVEPSPLSRCRCAAPEMHTYYRWTWAAPVDAGGDTGPDLAVIMLNPSCPDDAIANPTFRAISEWARQCAARSVTALNLVPRRADSRTLNRLSPMDLIGPDPSCIANNRDVIAHVLQDVDLALLAFGNVTARTMRRDAKQLILAEKQWLIRHLTATGLPAAKFLHDPIHPRRWAYLVNTNADVKQQYVETGYAGLLRAA